MNAPHQPEERQDYYARAASWAADRERSLRLSRRIAWFVAAGAAVVAIFEAVALALLVPLKTVVPYTILVDRHTGYVQVLKGSGAEPITEDWALTQSLLAQYVTAREAFDITSLNADYRKVALWSADRARSDYLAMMPASNPASPLARYPRTTMVLVRVKSVSPLAPNLALVRFDTERRDQGQGAGEIASWASVIRYRYSRAPMSLEDRLLNPLGFQIVHYRKDQEAPPPPAAEIVRPATTAAPSVRSAPLPGTARP
jgi:type IV secretion system protein VirB8